MEGSAAAPATDALALACMGLAAVLAVLHRRELGRVLWRDEDPRTMAAFRIATGLCTLGWALDLWPLVTYLFSDEGLFLTDAARQTMAAEAFAGLDEAADGTAARWLPGGIVHLAAGHAASPLLLWDAPAIAWTLWGLLVLSATALTLGVRTRVAKWASYALVIALVDRNTIFLAGEQVLLSALLVVCCARCDRAYSIDARGGPRESIPAWPRVLAVVMTVPLFFVNGVAKTGAGWAQGSTLHYLLHNPDFARFDASWIPPWISLGVLRPATWAAHAFELLFPLVVIGTFLRWRRSVAAARAPIGVAARLVWFALGACALGLAYAGFDPASRWGMSWWVVVLGAGATCLTAAGGPQLARRIPPGARAWMHAWMLGRRIWITALVGFTGSLCLLTDLGWFVPLTLASALLFFDGDELDRAVAWLRRRPARHVVWAPAPRGMPRWAIGWFLAWHVTACVAAWLPHAPEPGPLRAAIELPLRGWIAVAHTWQSYRMFAPQGPTAAFDLEVELVTDTVEASDDGLVSRAPRLFGPGRDKSHKIAFRLVTHEATAWFRKWHGRWLCRRYALVTGAVPTEVRLFRVRRTMPTPAGAPAGAIERVPLWTGRCAREVHGQPSPAIRARHGVTLAEPFVPWTKDRGAAWQQRRDRGEVPRWPWIPALVLGPPLLGGGLGAYRRTKTKTGTRS